MNSFYSGNIYQSQADNESLLSLSLSVKNKTIDTIKNS